MLEEVGQRIRDACPEGAAVGRLGGDEFLVLAGPLDSDATHGLAEKVRRRIAVDPVLAVPSAVHLTVSVGLCLRGPEPSSGSPGAGSTPSPPRAGSILTSSPKTPPPEPRA